METFVRKQRHEKIYQKGKIHRTILHDERPEKPLKK
jgi:hypothetical protein